MTTPPRPPETPEAPTALELDSPPMLSAQQRAALRAELSPLAADQARLRSAVWASLASGELPRSAQRMDALMQARAVGGAKLIGGSGLSGKLIAVGVLVAGAAGLIGWGLTRSATPVQPAAPSTAAAEGPRTTAAAPRTAPATAVEPAATQVRAAAPEPTRAERADTFEPRLERAGRARSGAQRTHASKPAHAQAPADETSSSSGEQAAAAPPSTTAPELEPAAQAQREPAPAPESVPRFDLAAELRLVRAASRALDRRDTGAALTQLQLHAARYPAGALRVEAAALRAMALCTAHAPEADAERRHFLRDHAASALAERVKRACPERP